MSKAIEKENCVSCGGPIAPEDRNKDGLCPECLIVKALMKEGKQKT